MARDRIEIGSEKVQGFQRQIGNFVGRVVESIKRKMGAESNRRQSNPWIEEEAVDLLKEIGRRAPHRHSAYR